MTVKRKPRPAQRPPAGKPASPLSKGGPRGVLGRPSPLLDTRIIYCGDCLDQLRKLPDACVDLIYIDPPFNSNRNYEVFWGETKEKRAFEDRHASTQDYIEYMRPRCVELARVLKKTGSFYYHCDWHASHYVKVFCGDEEHAETHQKRYHPTARIVLQRDLQTT
jgi:DNA modification methylase